MRNAARALTVIVDLSPGPFPRAVLEHRLAEIAAEPERNPWFRPSNLPDTHFMRFVIVDDPRGHLPSLLVWESNHDGSAGDYLAAVAREAPSIEAVFESGADYLAEGIADVDRWVAWMLAHARRTNAFYTAYPGVPHSMVHNDHQVHDTIRAILDHEDRTVLGALSHRELQRRICLQLAARRPELDRNPDGGDELRLLASRIVVAIGIAAALPFIIVFMLPWYLILRRKERTDMASAYVRPVDIDPAVQKIEDDGVQNQLSHIVDLKPGVFRLATLWLVLAAVNLVARVYAVRGDLLGVNTIHFARWVIVHDSRRRAEIRAGEPRRPRLMFLSNYDGSWDSYLGEFIDRLAWGLTAIWSNTRGFPSTRHLVFGGARDEGAFKQWAREYQIPTQVWWTGALDSTAQNINNDLWIRRRLARRLSDRDLSTWLHRL